MEKSSSSKVTVQYHDPSGVFSLLQPELEARLPLKNLHWKSPSRPLRNIDALHVEFVPDASASGSHGASGSFQRSNSVRMANKNPGDLWGGRSGGPRSTSQPIGQNTKQRRHQIPGLRETPYLRLFILRCDDKDAYKTEHRQQLKDWVRRNSPAAAQSTSALNKHDNHDASEWMIVHVVIPDTQAATEPRWTAAKTDPDELAERSKNKTKWTGKGTTTVFDKLRADFFPSSKSALERVAQIRLPKSAIPPDFLPREPVPSQLHETSQEQDNAWQDLISKFKSLILQSFDLRVGQYEEDIRERESQRSLPGWNFCTFFTLKEGLARGFESVGLVEDALAIYDELAAGLDVTTGDNTAFLGDMGPLRRELMNLASVTDGTSAEAEARDRIRELLDAPLDIGRKDYRNLIVSSTISLFDFHTYIFARQRLLIYRLGSFEPQDETPDSARTPVSATAGKPERAKTDEQLSYVAEVCRRASSFISTNTRTLRKEMDTTSGLVNHARYDSLVQSVAASWAYTTSEKILAETSVSLIYSPASASNTPVDPAFNFPQGANSYPSRRSSLATPQSAVSKSAVSVYENDKYPSPIDDSLVKSALAGSGLAELAANRGELCLLERRFLETLANKRGWRVGWSALATDYPLIDADKELQIQQTHLEHLVFSNLEISEALKSIEAYRIAFENITDLAIRHLLLGSRPSAVETLMGDLGLLRYQVEDYTAAAQILQKLISKYTTTDWSAIDAKMIHVYVDCLRILNRTDEYIRLSLALLRRRQKSRTLATSYKDDNIPQPDTISLKEIVDYSKDTTAFFKASFENLFAHLQFEPQIQHFDDKDGFCLKMSFDKLVEEDIMIDAVRVKLISTSAPVPEIVMDTVEPFVAGEDTNSIVLSTSLSTLGLYSIQQVVFDIGKIQFVHSFEPKQKYTPFRFAERSSARSQIAMVGPLLMLFPRPGSLAISTSPSPNIHVDHRRALHVRITNGNIGYELISLRLRPGTAGLRLLTSEASPIATDTSIEISAANTVEFKPSTNETVIVEIPYKLELPQAELTVKAEVVCTTGDKTFSFFTEEQISIELLLDVDVNDIFKPKNLFSRFSIRTTDGDPLVLHSAQIGSSKAHEVKSLGPPIEIPVFDKQPASLACKISKRSQSDLVAGNATSTTLLLSLSYSSVRRFVLDSLASVFNKYLAKSKVIEYETLLTYFFHRQLGDQIDMNALETTLLVQAITMPSYKTMTWDSILPVFPRTARAGVKNFLQSFHDGHQIVALDFDAMKASHKQTLIIPVDVPAISVLATARITLNNSAPVSSRLPPLGVVGQPLQATLSISYTTAWSSPPPAPGTPQKLIYNISEMPDTWLLAGPSSGTFTALESDTTAFPLLLIPLIPGILNLPLVEVLLASDLPTETTPLPTPLSAVPTSASSRTVLDVGLFSPTARSPLPRTPRTPAFAGNGAEYACETDCESAGATVLVVRPPGKAEVSVVEGERTGYSAAGGAVVAASPQTAGVAPALPSATGPGGGRERSGSTELLGTVKSDQVIV